MLAQVFHLSRRGRLVIKCPPWGVSARGTHAWAKRVNACSFIGGVIPPRCVQNPIYKSRDLFNVLSSSMKQASELPRVLNGVGVTVVVEVGPDPPRAAGLDALGPDEELGL